MAVRTKFDSVINEKTSAEITAVIEDTTGAIPGASLATLTLTLYDEDSGAIINLRSKQNVLNANGGTVDGSGVLKMLLLPADNVLINQGVSLETHIALFEFTYPVGTPIDGGSHEVELVVCQVTKVP